MQKWLVYPKEGAELIEIECERFEIRDGRFIIFNSVLVESPDGFLSYSDVAAMIPQKQMQADKPYPHTPICFQVYLRERLEPIEIIAHAFKFEDSQLVFKGRDRDMMGGLKNEWPLNNIYIAPSEVIAIVPKGGFIDREV